MHLCKSHRRSPRRGQGKLQSWSLWKRGKESSTCGLPLQGGLMTGIQGHAVLFWAFSAYGLCVVDSCKSRTRTFLYNQRTNWGITMVIPFMKCLLYVRQHAQCFSWNISNPQNNLRRDEDPPLASKLTKHVLRRCKENNSRHRIQLLIYLTQSSWWFPWVIDTS